MFLCDSESLSQQFFERFDAGIASCQLRIVQNSFVIEIIKRDDGSYLVDAQIPFYDFLSRFEMTDWMNEGEHEFNTLAGFVLHRLERIPHTGDKLEWKGFKLEIVDMDALRIDKILVTISSDIREGMDDED